MTDLTPGAFFLRHPGGTVGRLVAAGQAFVRGGSFWTHAGLILDDGDAVQGEPGGAKIIRSASLLDGRPLLVSDRPLRWSPPEVRSRVVAESRKLVGVGYSYLDYLALAAVEFHWPGSAWMRQRVQTSGHMICSALVDAAYLAAGIHLFDDGRLPGDVTPQDLAEYAEAER